MENEMMINEEVIEGAAEVAKVDKKGLIGLGIAGATLVGVIVYKKIVKPLIAKRKAKKQNTVIEADCDEPVEDQEVSEEI